MAPMRRSNWHKRGINRDNNEFDQRDCEYRRGVLVAESIARCAPRVTVASMPSHVLIASSTSDIAIYQRLGRAKVGHSSFGWLHCNVRFSGASKLSRTENRSIHEMLACTSRIR